MPGTERIVLEMKWNVKSFSELMLPLACMETDRQQCTKATVDLNWYLEFSQEATSKKGHFRTPHC